MPVKVESNSIIVWLRKRISKRNRQKKKRKQKHVSSFSIFLFKKFQNTLWKTLDFCQIIIKSRELMKRSKERHFKRTAWQPYRVCHQEGLMSCCVKMIKCKRIKERMKKRTNTNTFNFHM